MQRNMKLSHNFYVKKFLWKLNVNLAICTSVPGTYVYIRISFCLKKSKYIFLQIENYVCKSIFLSYVFDNFLPLPTTGAFQLTSYGRLLLAIFYSETISAMMYEMNFQIGMESNYKICKIIGYSKLFSKYHLFYGWTQDTFVSRIPLKKVIFMLKGVQFSGLLVKIFYRACTTK